MPATSQAQQKLMGQAYALKKGDIEASEINPEYVDQIKKLADSMSLDQLKDFAKTKREDLPIKKESVQTSNKLKHLKTFEDFIAECNDDWEEEEKKK